jgi:hypothetical protein
MNEEDEPVESQFAGNAGQIGRRVAERGSEQGEQIRAASVASITRRVGR